MTRIGIIGGSGLYDMAGVAITEERMIATPFGEPSDALRLGTLDGVAVAFLPRHGRGHRKTPSEINYRANLWALKSVGVEAVLSVSAVGSMKEAIVPGHLVFPDQFIDRTRGFRADTFFGDGLVAHVSLADPICPLLRGLLRQTAERLDLPHHDGGTYLNIEGPQFSTRAESHLYRTWGVSVIGMTNVTEARLAREAELHYATIAMSTDYDCWHASEEAVSVDAVVKTLLENVHKAQALIRAAVPAVAASVRGTCPCPNALDAAVMTAPDRVPPVTRERLALLLARRDAAAA